MDSTNARLEKLNKIAIEYNSLLLKLEDYGMTMQESVELGLPKEVTRDLLKSISSTQEEVLSIHQVLSTISTDWKCEIALFEDLELIKARRDRGGDQDTRARQRSEKAGVAANVKESAGGIMRVVDESLYPRYSKRAASKHTSSSSGSGAASQKSQPQSQPQKIANMNVHPSRLGLVPGTDPSYFVSSGLTANLNPAHQMTATQSTDPFGYYNASGDPRSH